MQDGRHASKWRNWVGWLFLGGLMFFLNSLVPNFADDWHYAQFGWGDILQSSWHEYLTWNGRYFSNIMMRILAHVPGTVADLMGTFAFLLLFLVLVVLATGKEVEKALSCFLTPLMLWVILVYTSPNFGECFLWHCGMANYLLPPLVTFTVLIPFRYALYTRLEPECKIWQLGGSRLALVAGALLCIVGGWSNENSGFVASMLAVGITVYVWNTHPHKRALSVYALLMLLGWVALYLSPGVACRTQVCKELGFYNDIWKTANAILKTHVPALPLYVVLFFLIRNLARRKIWNSQESIFFAALVACGCLCQGAFAASPVLPPARAHQVAFLFIGIAALRVMWLSYTSSSHKARWRVAVVVLSIIPCLEIPVLYSEHEQIKEYQCLMEKNAGNGNVVILPYWHYRKGHFFPFAEGYASSNENGQRSKALSRIKGIKGVVQSNARCSYCIDLPLGKIDAISYDVLENKGGALTASGFTKTEINISPREGACPRTLWIASPDKKRNRCKSFRMVYRLFVSRSDDVAGADDLLADGYIIGQFQLQNDMKATWTRDSDPAPACPTLWFAISQGDGGTPPKEFHRVEANRYVPQ